MRVDQGSILQYSLLNIQLLRSIIKYGYDLNFVIILIKAVLEIGDELARFCSAGKVEYE